jgi:dTMP kinase
MKYKVSFEIDFARNTHPGKFITIEGMDGSGKTTQVNNLVESLNRKGIKAVFTKEPTDGEIGKMIRTILAGKVKIPPVAFQYLFVADRAVHQEEIIRELKKGTYVICDRYFWSALVYGMLDVGAVDTSEKKRLMTSYSILSMYHKFLVPDYTFYLSISVNEVMKRIKKSRDELSIYETRAKIDKLRTGYEWLSKNFPKEITRIDGEREIREITGEIVKKLP